MPDLIFQNKTKVSCSHFFNKYVAAYLGRQAPLLRKQRKYDFAAFAHDFIGLQINVFGLYEKEELESLFEFLAPLEGVFEKSSVFDIGANIGNHSVFFSDKFQKVVAFEPNPSTFLLLQFNTRNHDHITVHNYGLGDEEGSFKMSERLSNKGGSSICLEESDQELVEIQVKKMDSIDIDGKDVSLMKIDVEGFESKVLSGGRKAIERFQPLILFEQLEKEFDGGVNPSINLLKELGYKFCWQKRGVDRQTLLPRVFLNVLEFITGRSQMIFSDTEVPKGSYPMLIAVPKRFQKPLGLLL